MNKSIAKLLIAMLFVQLAILAFVYTELNSAREDDARQAHEARKEIRMGQFMACERGKLDRRDNADFQRAHTTYITTVTGAASVKEDVKVAAREAKKTFDRTADSLDARSRIDCAKAYPALEDDE